MSWKKTLGLVIVAALLGGYYYWYEVKGGEQRKAAEEAAQRGERGAAALQREDLLSGTRPRIRSLALRQLIRRGWVRGDAGLWQLTETGRERAVQLVRAHRLWEAYLEQEAALPADHLHAPAEQMEHYVGPELMHELEAELHQPARDPHGRTIPPEPDSRRPG